LGNKEDEMPATAGSNPSAEDHLRNATPAWQARWCWTTFHLPRPWNTYAYFRRSIDLPDRPTSAVVRVSADARYTLFVNGQRVHQGPARSFPHAQSYDTLDLADFLTAGLNAICAIVHQFGVPTAQSVYRDATGFVLDGSAETHAGTFPLHTPDDWLCRDAAGWRKHVARLSANLGFQEHFDADADADPPDWMTPEYTPTPEGGWKPPIVVAPIGGHPWVAMRSRGAPLLADEIISFNAIVSQFTGENARGYKVTEDVFHLPLQETRKRAKATLEAPDAILRDDDQATTLPPPPDGQFHMAVLDLGQIRTGHLILQISQAAGDEIIDVLYLSELDKNLAPQLAAGDSAPADRYRCRPGAQRWESFLPKGFRYAALIFRNVEQPLKIRHVGVRVIGAAGERSAPFDCSDEQLNAIHRAGVETIRACSTDAYIDGADAGQIQRWANARIIGRAAAYATGDIALLERGILQVAQSQTADGSLHSHPPSDDPQGRTIDSMLAWIGTLFDHHFHTGRTELLRACRPALDRLLEFFASHEIREGLLGGLEGFPLSKDATPSDPAFFNAAINLGYLQALRWSADLYEALDRDEQSARLSTKADALAQSVDKHFWDAKAKAWKDAFDPATSAAIDQTSVHVNALALLLNLRPDAQAAIARDVILKSMTARRSKTSVPSPSLAACALDALVHANLRAEAIELVRYRWGAMLERGATTLWEHWDGATGSRCWGAAASPVYLLLQQVLGVRPIAIGWKRVRIAPLVGTLEFARGTVPSPLGTIRVEWEKVGEDQLAVRIELPPGTQGEFVGPLGETRQLESGASEFHT
jgi:alpha-L-rhamnosidase